MARYLAVMAVRREGRRVPPDGAGDAQPPVPAGMRLVAVVNNGDWQSALDVTFPRAYDDLRRRCRAGVWREMELYLVGEERAREIEDARRILMNGEPVPGPRPGAGHRRSM